jgi:hypothetical protein
MIFVQNASGREMKLSLADYAKLKAKGFKMILLDKEPIEVVPTNAVMYTAICGDYPFKRDDIQCFGDEGIFKNPIMEAKRYKILPHRFFGTDTIWIDGNINFKESPDYAMARFLKDADIAIFKHPFRETVWQEFEVLKQHQRFQIPWLQNQLSKQVESYKKEGLPEDMPLWECNFILRRNNERVNRLMDAWWSEICRWQWRDQVSFPYVMWKYGKDVKMRTIEEGNIRVHKLFKYADHYGKVSRFLPLR